MFDKGTEIPQVMCIAANIDHETGTGWGGAPRQRRKSQAVSAVLVSYSRSVSNP